MIRRNRKPNWRRIKTLRSYTIDEAAKALGVHRNTIRHWIKKSGLRAFTDQRPHLIQGGDLVACLQAPLKPSPRPSAGARPAAAGRRGARRMTTARRAFRSGTRRTARCWCAAMPAATRSASSRRCAARGLWAENGPRPLLRVPRRTPVERKPDQDDARRSEVALAIWQSAKPAQGTPVETYLASRGIDLPPPDALRFHAGLKHPSGGIWPAMVALVTRGADGNAARDPPHLPCPRRRRQGAGRSAEDDARSMPWRCGAARRRRATC